MIGICEKKTNAIADGGKYALFVPDSTSFETTGYPPDPIPQNINLKFYAFSRWPKTCCLFLATIPRDSCRGFALFYV